MGLETATHLDDLVTTNPVAGDAVSQGDDHLRLLKSVLKTTFPSFTRPFYHDTVTSSSADVTLTATNDRSTQSVDATAASRTVALPDSPSTGYEVTVSKSDSSVNTVTINRSGTNTINGATSYVLYAQYETIKLKYLGGGLWITQGGGNSFLDNVFSLKDNADITKVAQFQLSGLTTATTRTFTLPDISDTLVTLTATQMLSNKTFSDRVTITQTSADAGIIASTGYSLTGSSTTPMIDLAGTWNTSGAPTAFKLNITHTAANAAAKLIDLQVDGTSKFSIQHGNAVVRATGYYYDTTVGYYLADGVNGYWTSGGNFRLIDTALVQWLNSSNGNSGTPDVILRRDAANTLALRNSTSAQTFNVYNTYTDASNYERGFIRYASSILQIGHEAAGTGVGNRLVNIRSNGASQFEIDGAGNAYATTGIGIKSSLLIGGPSTGVATLLNWDANDFNRLQFGGTTSSFPALKRSTTELQVRLADDSGFATLALGTASSALKVGTHSAIAAETVTGYITIKDSGGTDRKIAVVS